MTTWCVDANVVIATLLNEPASDAARRFWAGLTQADEVVGPYVLLPECTSALRRKVLDGSVSEAEGLELIDELLALPIRIETSAEQFRRSLDWAIRTRRRRMNDLQYVVVAQISGAEIVTLDGGVRQAALEQGVAVRFLR